MEIRRKLTYQFILIVALILMSSFIAIYILVARFRTETFYSRLEGRGLSVAQLLIDVEEVNTEVLRRIERTSSSSLPEEKIAIYDYHNDIIYSSDNIEPLKIDDALIDNIRLTDYIRYTNGSYEILGLYYKSKYDRFVVFAGAQDIFGFEKMRNLRFILFTVFIVSLVIVFIAGTFFSDRALHPIRDVMDQVDKIGFANLDQRVSEGNGKDEIAKLAGTFNNLLKRLESAFKIQKNFIANASHELRTPLTIITGELEVLLLSERSSEEYRAVICSVLDDIKNLNTISNRLLLLAQTSSDPSNLNLSPLRIDDLLWNTSREIIKKIPSYSVHVGIDPALDDENLLTVRGSETLLKTVFTNVIENACKYSPEEKSVYINLVPGNGELYIYFKDHGIGIHEEDLSMIFQPFYRGKNSHDFNGSGIGLSLAERIVILHGGSIRVDSELGKGSEFIIRFPLSASET